jgi:hypothetical protein
MAGPALWARVASAEGSPHTSKINMPYQSLYFVPSRATPSDFVYTS